MIEPAPSKPESTVFWQPERINREFRWQQFGVVGTTVWLTGLSGSGKSTLANALGELLVENRRLFTILDGDNVRHGLNADLSLSPSDRDENVRRLGEASLLLADAGVVVVVAAVSPYRVARGRVRSRHLESMVKFVEVFVDTPLKVCEARDPKGLYQRSRRGEISGMTGVDAPYEAPENAEVVLSDSSLEPRAAAERIFAAL